MAEKQIFERKYDSGTIDGINGCDRQFDILGKRIEKLKIELKTTFDCSEYISREIQAEFTNISTLLEWNQKRINILNEISIKNKKISENILELYDEMYNLFFNNCKCNEIETQK